MNVKQTPSGLVVPTELEPPPKHPKLQTWEGSYLGNVVDVLGSLDKHRAMLISVVKIPSSGGAGPLGQRYIVTFEHTEDLDFETWC